MRDDVILGWAKGNPSAQEILAQGGIELLRDSPIVPGFVALSVVAFVGFALLVLVLGSFFVGGYGWTRPVLTATAGLRRPGRRGLPRHHLPVIFVVLSACDRRGPGALVLPLAARDDGLPASGLTTSRRPSASLLVPGSVLRLRPQESRQPLTGCRWGGVPFSLFEHLFDATSGGGDLDPHRPPGRPRGRRSGEEAR